MAFPKNVKELCTPAYVYLMLSVFGIILSIFQNLGNRYTYRLGYYHAKVPHTMLVFILKVFYILFWTWILNMMCKDGHKNIAWLLVILPFVLVFFLMSFPSSSSSYMLEGMENATDDKKKKKATTGMPMMK
jgi:hypothetical protein